jgi:hypothetical protein
MTANLPLCPICGKTHFERLEMDARCRKSAESNGKSAEFRSFYYARLSASCEMSEEERKALAEDTPARVANRRRVFKALGFPR